MIYCGPKYAHVLLMDEEYGVIWIDHLNGAPNRSEKGKPGESSGRKAVDLKLMLG